MSSAFGRLAIIDIGTAPAIPGVPTLDGIRVDSLATSFKVVRDLSETPNSCELEIINLNPDHRALVMSAANTLQGALVRVQAGYVDDTAEIFLGYCNDAYQERDGVDWVTRLSIDDGAEDEEEHPTKPGATVPAKLDMRFARGALASFALRQMVEKCGLQMSAITSALPLVLSSGSPVFTYPVHFKGDRKEQLARLANSLNLTWSIQSGVFEGQLRGVPFSVGPLLRTGGTLLRATQTSRGAVSGSCLLDHRIKPGTMVTIDGSTVKGAYNIDSAEHSGSTSGVGDWVTSFTGIPI
jgi:hypothetical protein